MKVNQYRKAAGLLPALGCTSGMDLLLASGRGRGRSSGRGGGQPHSTAAMPSDRRPANGAEASTGLQRRLRPHCEAIVAYMVRV